MESNELMGKVESTETNSKSLNRVKPVGNNAYPTKKNNPNQTDYINIYWDEWHE